MPCCKSCISVGISGMRAAYRPLDLFQCLLAAERWLWIGHLDWKKLFSTTFDGRVEYHAAFVASPQNFRA